MREEDLPFVVQQHRHHFPHGFFARLGPTFLRAYYRTFLTSPYAYAMTAVEETVPIAFVVGMTAPAEHRRHVLSHHRRSLLARGALALLCRPRLLVQFLRLRARTYWRKVCRLPSKGSTAQETDGRRRPAVLAHVVVSTTYQGRGLGTRLIGSFEDAAAAAGCDSLLLVTESGGRAAEYYRKSMWTPVREHQTAEGMALTTFARPLPAPSAASGEPSREKPTPKPRQCSGKHVHAADSKDAVTGL